MCTHMCDNFVPNYFSRNAHDGVTRVNALNLARSIFNFLNLSASFLHSSLAINFRKRATKMRRGGRWWKSGDGNCAVTRLRDQNSHCTYYYCFRYRCKYQRGWRRNNDRRKGPDPLVSVLHIYVTRIPDFLSVNAR